jgi:hypothetical protein
MDRAMHAETSTLSLVSSGASKQVGSIGFNQCLRLRSMTHFARVGLQPSLQGRQQQYAPRWVLDVALGWPTS